MFTQYVLSQHIGPESRCRLWSAASIWYVIICNASTEGLQLLYSVWGVAGCNSPCNTAWSDLWVTRADDEATLCDVVRLDLCKRAVAFGGSMEGRWASWEMQPKRDRGKQGIPSPPDKTRPQSGDTVNVRNEQRGQRNPRLSHTCQRSERLRKTNVIFSQNTICTCLICFLKTSIHLYVHPRAMAHNRSMFPSVWLYCVFQVGRSLTALQHVIHIFSDCESSTSFFM